MSLRNLFFLLFFLLSTFTFAQQAGKDSLDEFGGDTVEYKKNFVMAYAFSDHSYRSVYTDHGILQGHQDGTGNNREPGSFGEPQSGSFGLGFMHQLKKNLSVEVGVEISAEKYTTETIYPPINPSSTLPRQEASISYVNHTEFFNIPVGVRYTIGKKLRIGAYVGLAPKICMEDYVRYSIGYTDGSALTDGTGFKGKKSSFNINARFGAFAECNFWKSKIRIMPVWRYDLLNTFGGHKGRKGSSQGIGIEVLI